MFPLPIGTIIKAIVALVITLVIAGGLWYVTGLRADLAVSQENTKKMVEAVEQQKLLLKRYKLSNKKLKISITNLIPQLSCRIKIWTI